MTMPDTCPDCGFVFRCGVPGCTCSDEEDED